MEGRLASLNVGAPRTVRWRGRDVRSAIWKAPAAGRLSVRGVNVEGDDQADRRVHGGPDKALYAYGTSDYAVWAERLGRPLEPATFGENLTIEGVEVSSALVGERWRVGAATLRVTEPRIPCFKLGMRMGDERFPKQFGAVCLPGAYLAIEEEGELGAGDALTVLSRPRHGITVATVARAYLHDHRLAATLLDVPELSSSWRRWAERVAGAA